MDYIEVSFEFEPVSSDNREILAALLGQIDFESFSDTKQGLNAYIQEPLFNTDAVNESIKPLQAIFENLTFKVALIKDQNWNAEWEKNFSPINIIDTCRIRAPFHPSDGNFQFEIEIEPKMSFGTGHHATTALMVQFMLEMDLKNQEILDMGCGTGVLAILASFKNAKNILAIDIDNWAFENTIENIERNKVSNIETLKGDASLLINRKFDVILANINRNILLKDLESYSKSLANKGQLLLSGFYTQDLALITEKAESLGLSLQKHIENDNWVAAKFINGTN
jgi:ribosomal protein L11 methyltransferase